MDISYHETCKQLIDDLGGVNKTAKSLGVSQATVSGWQLGYHGMSAMIAIRAERVTSGRYKAHKLSKHLCDTWQEAGI